MSPLGVCPPKDLIFSTSSSLCPKTLDGESADFVVKFDMAKDANLLNVLAEAKNEEFCQYNLDYLEKSASLLVQYGVTNFIKRMLVSSGSLYDMPDHKMYIKNLFPSLVLLKDCG